MKRKILVIFLMVALVLSIAPLTAVASDGYNLIATGTQGTEDRITVDLPEGTTLGQLQSISWKEWLEAGYPPHLDVRLDLNGDNAYMSGVDAVLTFEYAHNGHSIDSQLTPPTAYGALTGAWYDLFNDDGNGPAAITGTANAWLSAAGTAPGPYDQTTYTFGANNFWLATLDDWKSGKMVTAGGNTYDVSAATKVLYLEIEVDNWIVNTTAMIKDISVDFGSASAVLSAVVTDPPSVVSVVLNLGSIDFGTVYRGSSSEAKVVRVTNGGNVAISVVTTIEAATGSPFSSSNLAITPNTFSIDPGGYVDVELVLTIPSDFAPGSYSSAGALTFTATEQ